MAFTIAWKKRMCELFLKIWRFFLHVAVQPSCVLNFFHDLAFVWKEHGAAHRRLHVTHL